MEISKAVRCMRHCSSGYNIFYVDFPKFCPICRKEIQGSYLVVPPFLVPHPFRASCEAKYNLVVKPTQGCFLTDYQSEHDLHIGITNSTGLVYNYDVRGVHIDQHGWSLCVAVDLSKILVDSRVAKDWDTRLEHHSKQPEWTQNRYHVQTHNCYNFVLSFLQTLQPSDEVLQQHFQTKESFCKKFIVPLTTRAAQYIDLRRTILSGGPLVKKVNTGS